MPAGTKNDRPMKRADIKFSVDVEVDAAIDASNGLTDSRPWLMAHNCIPSDADYETLLRLIHSIKRL